MFRQFYVLTNGGIVDTTISLVRLNKKELKLMGEFIKNHNVNSDRNTQPILELYKINFSLTGDKVIYKDKAYYIDFRELNNPLNKIF